jgi:hypothetical protein
MADRFPAEVADVLRAHGWHEGRRVAEQTAEAIRLVGHEPFPAAVEALEEFGGVYVTQDGPGRELRRRPFAVDPTLAPPCAETLADLGRVLGVRLYPLGVEGDGDALLAIDERHRVFALDHAGEWFLGETPADAITALVSGVQPNRIRDDGTW